ncbi:MAG: hypothetical protein KAH08_01110 [Methylococcales bacterium]|nr:hypothetical protein [Methylococcales bacterium]
MELVFKDVLKQVSKITKEKQTPWFNSSVEGDFYFVTVEIKQPNATPRVSTQEEKEFMKEKVEARCYFNTVKSNV